MQDRYRLLAPFYSKLSRLVFGAKIEKATTCFQSKIPNKSLIIIGGGDGQHFVPIQQELSGEYWELSASMLQQAQRNLSQSELSFHLGGFGRSSNSKKYPLVFLPFVLDTLTDSEILELLEQVKYRLSPEGEVMISDFYPTKNRMQLFIQWIMIAFFRLFAHHSRVDLPDIEKLMSDAGFELLQEMSWEKGWIKSQVFGKKP
ncbi:methyltransferase domain-containing protein [Algoriphagus sp.]|uniref:methyltransferase domain-containing protein n=1 Tax=Algoriphagus sp. TaxID=1872435 RepID=UPI00260AB5EC|nr:methyltransferase domain-containing protein [Algoriphagus sp.]